jgi:hypothetical protein
MQYYLVSFAGKWMEVEIIVLSEINQTEKDLIFINLLFHSLWNLVLQKNDRSIKWTFGGQGPGGRGRQKEG